MSDTAPPTAPPPGRATPRPGAVFRFAGFELDPHRRRLRRDGVDIEIQDQTFDLIHYLVDNSGRVLSKQDLLEGAWRHIHLSDAAISQAIRRARQALGDDGKRQAVIRTVHGRGVQFLPEVETHEAVQPSASAVATSTRTQWLLPSLAACLLVVLFSAAVFYLPADSSSRSEAAVEPTIRILLEAPQGIGVLDPEQRWIGKGLEDALVTMLRNVPGVSLVDADSTPELGQADFSTRAGMLGVDRVLQLALEPLEGGIRLRWTLRSPQREPLAQGSIESPDPGLLVRQLLDRLSPHLGQGVPHVHLAHADLLSDPLAVELYSRAMQSIHREQRDEAIDLLRAALTRQPDSGLLQVAMAKARFDPAEDAGNAMDRYQSLLERLPEADRLSRAWLSYELGTEHWFYGNIEAAAVFLEEALSRIDGLEEPFLRGRILNSYAFVKQSLNEFDRSWEMALEAEQIFRRLESPYFRSMVLTNLGYLADDFGRLLQARDFHLEALSLRQPFEVEELIAASEYGLARIERRMGLLADAASRLEANLAGQGIRNRPFDHFDNMEELAEVRMRQGRFDEAARFLDQAQALAAASDDTIGLAWSAEVRGRLAVASDRLEPDVRQDLLAAIKALEGLGDDQEVFTASLTLVEFMQQSGETAEAEVRLAALADHPALANPVHHIRYRIVRGRQAALIGLADESRNLLEAALLRARQLGSVDQEAAAAIELAWQAHRRGEPNAAQRYLRIARRWAPEDFRTAELERAMPTQAES